MRVHVEWRHKLQATNHAQPGDGFRSVFAWMLRHIADRIDKGQSVRIEYSTTPRVSPRLAADCIERGLSHANSLLADMAHQEACERALLEHSQELFGEADQ